VVIRLGFDSIKWGAPLLFVLLLTVVLSFLGVEAQAQSASDHPLTEHLSAPVMSEPTHEAHPDHGEGSWEGSAQGVAYSEFNHRFVGLCVLLFGLAELGHALQYSLPVWIRFVLPGTLAVIGPYLLIWSDHEAWPIGPLTFVQTFTGQDPEILQHKFYGVFSSLAAFSEALRRISWVRHPGWAVPLFILGMGGALLLFFHSHGEHPRNYAITLHHTLLGSFGVGAAVSHAMVAWAFGLSSQTARKWELAWAGFVIAMGLQLLLYFE
jgi:putative copper resistance protein D